MEVFMKERSVKVPPDVSPELKQRVFEMYLSICETLKDTPEVRRMMRAREEARRAGEEEGRMIGVRKGREIGLQRGLREGRQEGRQEGRAEAFRALLSKQCIQRSAGDRYAQKIENADSEQLERWLSRLLAGEELQDVLEGSGP
jgi:flagellar biosynthesis/type III secretory pathway protein FliH